MGIRNRRMKYLKMLSLFEAAYCECVHGKELGCCWMMGGKKLRSFSNGRTARP